MSKASLRRAAEFRIEQKEQPGQAHRSAAGGLIDYRLQEITDSAMRAICTVPGNFADKPKFASPWHFHDCDLQVALILDGSVELGYRGDTYARAEKGDILFIPGKTAHDVGSPSADYQIAEITFPGSFGTIETPMPAKDAATPAVTLGSRDAVRMGEHHGLVEYRYPVAEPYGRTYDLRRYLRSRTEPFAATSRHHEDHFRASVPFAGWADVDLGDGETVRVGVGDLLLVTPHTDCRLVAVSDDYAAVEVRLLHTKQEPAS